MLVKRFVLESQKFYLRKSVNLTYIFNALLRYRQK